MCMYTIISVISIILLVVVIMTMSVVVVAAAFVVVAIIFRTPDLSQPARSFIAQSPLVSGNLIPAQPLSRYAMQIVFGSRGSAH